jgi:hypothetical protein
MAKEAQKGDRGVDPTQSQLPGMTRDTLYKRLGAPRGRSGRQGKSLPPPGFDSRTLQPAASRYTDWAIPGAFWNMYSPNFNGENDGGAILFTFLFF